MVSAVNTDRLRQLANDLTGTPGVDTVASFGTSLHVSGRDADMLDRAIAPHRMRDGLDWKYHEPSLEDAFIELVNKARANSQ